MPFSISKFRGGALNNSGARPNLFDVQLVSFPEIGLTGSEFTFACKASVIPAMAVGVVEVPYFGRMVKVPGNKTFENWSLTIINDEDFNIRNAIEKWIAAMGTHEKNVATIGTDFMGQGGSRILHRHIPSSRLVIVPGRGHALYREDSISFNSEIVKFFGTRGL